MIKILHYLALFLVKNAILCRIFRRRFLENHNIGPRFDSEYGGRSFGFTSDGDGESDFVHDDLDSDAANILDGLVIEKLVTDKESI
jgi:hypothetical protein